MLLLLMKLWWIRPLTTLFRRFLHFYFLFLKNNLLGLFVLYKFTSCFLTAWAQLFFSVPISSVLAILCFLAFSLVFEHNALYVAFLCFRYSLTS